MVCIGIEKPRASRLTVLVIALQIRPAGLDGEVDGHLHTSRQGERGLGDRNGGDVDLGYHFAVPIVNNSAYGEMQLKTGEQGI